RRPTDCPAGGTAHSDPGRSARVVRVAAHEAPARPQTIRFRRRDGLRLVRTPGNVHRLKCARSDLIGATPTPATSARKPYVAAPPHQVVAARLTDTSRAVLS